MRRWVVPGKLASRLVGIEELAGYSTEGRVTRRGARGGGEGRGRGRERGGKRKFKTP
jgi:hypothetical protein